MRSGSYRHSFHALASTRLCEGNGPGAQKTGRSPVPCAGDAKVRLRILYLTQTFPPEPGPTIRPLEQARCLARHGHDVRVITTFPYYPTGVLRPEDRRVLRRREVHDGIPVLRVASLPAANNGRWRRLGSWASFACHAALAVQAGPTSDVVIASIPNAGTEVAGLFIARVTRAAFILELRDLLPDSMQLGGLRRNSAIYSAAERGYGAVYRRADAIAVPSETMADALCTEYGVQRARVLIVPHGADRERFSSASGAGVRQRLHLQGKFVAAYAGSFSPYYGVGNIVDAAALTSGDTRVHWMLIGDGPEREAIARRVRTAGLANVSLVDAVSPTAIPDWLAAADVCITSLRTAGTLPYTPDRLTKVCDYLALGKPVVAVESEPLCGPFLASIGAGRAVPWGRPELLAKAVVDLSNDAPTCQRHGVAAARFAERELSRERTMGPLLAWLTAFEAVKRNGDLPPRSRTEDRAHV